MLDGIRWTSIIACLYFATLTFAAASKPLSTKSATPEPQSQSTSTGSPRTQQDSDSDPLAGNAAAQRTVTATKRWLAGTMSTPGMTAQLREIARASVKGKLEVQYHIFVIGAPKDQTYTLID